MMRLLDISQPLVLQFVGAIAVSRSVTMCQKKPKGVKIRKVGPSIREDACNELSQPGTALTPPPMMEVQKAVDQIKGTKKTSHSKEKEVKKQEKRKSNSGEKLPETKTKKKPGRKKGKSQSKSGDGSKDSIDKEERKTEEKKTTEKTTDKKEDEKNLQAPKRARKSEEDKHAKSPKRGKESENKKNEEGAKDVDVNHLNKTAIDKQEENEENQENAHRKGDVDYLNMPEITALEMKPSNTREFNVTQPEWYMAESSENAGLSL